MIPHPFERFLGVPYDADAWTLLGVPHERAEPLLVDEALRARLAEVFRHPDGRSVEAEEAREALRHAAAEVKRVMQQQRREAIGAAPPHAGAELPPWMRGAVRSKGHPRSFAPVVFNLTAFDKLVLSVLVACGGWNAQSRAELVALAQNYGVTVDGLLRVIQGLGEYARSGGPRLGVSEIAGGQAPPPTALSPVASSAAPPVGPALLDRLAENFGQELERGGPWATIKLSILFGIVTLIACIVALRMLLRNSDPPTTPPAGTTTNAAAVTPATQSAARQDNRAAESRLARFAKVPTFLGNGLPADAANAVDRCPNLPAQIEELSRKVVVADGNVSEAVYQQWSADIKTIATAWAIAEASTRDDVTKAIFETLRTAADTPAVSDRLLKALLPPVSLTDPLDIWRGAWMAGTLGRIASSKDLPPVVVDRARSQLEIALSQNLRNDVTFEAASDLWLAQRLDQLVQMLPLDDRRYDFWELWISAERAVGVGDRHDAAIMRALRDALTTDVDLMNSQPTLNVAARLMQIAIDSGSGVVRQRMLELFDDEAIAARDLWVITSILATGEKTRWFPDELVLPDDADMRHRWRIRDDLSSLWPMPATAATQIDEDKPPEFDEMEGGRWIALVETMLVAPVAHEPRAIMEQLVQTSTMVEAAAALVADVPEEARRAMNVVEGGRPRPPTQAAPQPASTPVPGHAPARTGPAAYPQPTPQQPPGSGKPQQQPRVGQPIGTDGVWAAEYGQLGKAAEPRIESLQSLRTKAGTDLGPIDAALLVREAYRGSPSEVKAIALGMISQQFARGPNVAMQLLDQFPDVAASDALSEMIQAMTQRMLPPSRSSAWTAEARHALVDHTLSLLDTEGAPVEEAIEPLIETYTSRLGLIRRDPGVATPPDTPEEAASQLLRTMLDQAELAAPSAPTPADLPNLQRRHNTRMSLAEGPIQKFVAQQLAILDVTVYLTVAEQPRTRDRALEIMREHANTRSRMPSVLEQALDVERTVLEIWRLRLGFDPQVVAPEDLGGAT